MSWAFGIWLGIWRSDRFMKRCVIIGGAPIKNYAEIKKSLAGDDFYIYCDSGLRHESSLGHPPQLIVGDFDSHENPCRDIETIVLPCEKDDTDTVFAVKEALNRGFDEFILIGAAGGRLDHTLANTSLLYMLHKSGKKAILIDDLSQMEIVSKDTAYIDASFSYFSLLNIFGTAKGITIKNAKYPLIDAEITCEYQYGVSNEVISGKTAEVTVSDGTLLLIKVF